jgi:Flp pilus assembly protein TadG
VRRDQGAAVVEFVLVTALMVPLFLGIAQLGLVLHVRNTLTAAAGEGARAGAPLGATAQAAEARTRRVIGTALAARFAREVTVREVTRDGLALVQVRVRADVPALGLFGPSVSLDVTGHAVREVAP